MENVFSSYHSEPVYEVLKINQPLTFS